MRRKFFTTASALAGVLFLATTAAWILSSSTERFTLNVRGHAVGVGIDRPTLSAYWRYFDPAEFSRPRTAPPLFDHQVIDPAPPEPTSFGFETERGVTVRVPDWLWSSAFLCAAWIFFHLRHPRRRRITNACPSCGYDLRATPNRCPECGTAPPRTPVSA